MTGINVKRIQNQVNKYRNAREAPNVIIQMVAREIAEDLTTYRTNAAKYLETRSKAILALSEALHAEHCSLTVEGSALKQLKYGSMTTEALKMEMGKVKDYESGCVLANVLRSRKCGKDADVLARRLSVMETDHWSDPELQTLLADVLAGQNSLMSPTLLPVTPIDSITRADIANNRVPFQSIEKICNEIVGRELGMKVYTMVEQLVPPAHLPLALNNQFQELSGYRMTLDPTLEEATSGMTAEVQADFLAKAAAVNMFAKDPIHPHIDPVPVQPAKGNNQPIEREAGFEARVSE